MSVNAKRLSQVFLASAAILSVFSATGCGSKDNAATTGEAPAASSNGGALSGKVSSDGSSTVEPIISAMAEQFRGPRQRFVEAHRTPRAERSPEGPLMARA